jgi:hypothetical protein
MLRWTILPDGGTQKKKCWNITNYRDTNTRAFGYKLLMGFLPTLARQRAWYPGVYSRPELYRCAKCGQTEETQKHIYDCADHTETEEHFRNEYQALQPTQNTPIDLRELSPWRPLGWLQGRVHPEWETTIPELQHDTSRATGSAIILQLLRASLVTGYNAIWLPRCKRTIAQERSQGLYQGAKLRRMRARNRNDATAPPSPTPSLPNSFISGLEQTTAYRRFLSQLMHGTDGH